MPLPLSSKKLAAARDAARSGKYQLLLGAGASVGATNPHGQLPLAQDLVKILAAEYPKAPIDENGTLPRAYQRAVMVSSPESVWQTFKKVFSGASHDEWFVDLACLPWRRVWTLNIDDTFENAYGSVALADDKKLKVVDWQDTYEESGDLQVVHLHGHIIDRKPRKLVFSFSEYQSAAETHPVWDKVLSGVVGSEPFLIIGAKLLGDPDIEAMLMNNPPKGFAPSFVIDPYIADDYKWELEQLGFTVLKVMPLELVKEWRNTFGLTADSLRALKRSHALSIPQFTKLQTNVTSPPPGGHDFFGGDSPLWSDSVAGRTALMDWTRPILNDLRMWAADGANAERQTLHIVYGERLTGSSSGLYAIAKEVTKLNIEPLIFDRSSRWDVSLMVDLARQQPAVLLLDGGAEFADDIDRTLKLASDQEARLYVILGDTPTNDLRLEGRLTGTYVKRVTKIPPRLGRDDSRLIVSLLEKFGRLGRLELKQPASRINHFARRDIFSAMAEVEYSVGFRKRIEGELNAIDPQWCHQLILLLALAAQANRPVEISEAAIAVGVSADKVAQAIQEDRHFSALVERVEGRLLARQRDRSMEPVIKKLGDAIALGSVLEFIQRLAPMASRRSLQKRNRVPLLVGHLMTSKSLSKAFPRQDLEGFYETLRPTFGDWNGRYWEQRAIYAKSKREWSRAESFAAKSVSLYDDAFTRTTYGTILLNRAEQLAAVSDPAWRSFYERGEDELEVAQQKEPGSRVTAFAYLEATLALLRSLSETANNQSGDVDEIAMAWMQHYTTLRVSLASEQSLHSVRRAERLGERWGELRSIFKE